MKTIRLSLLAIVSVAFLSGTAYAGSTTNQKLPISGTFINACTGEGVNYSGTLHVVITQTPKDKATYRYRMNAKITATAVGAPSGEDYRFEENDHESLIDASGCPFSDTYTTFIRVIGKGSLPNEQVKATVTIIVYPDCTIGGSIVITTTCQ